MAFRYEDFEVACTLPNVVVDGSGNEATVLSLSHWPGQPTPAALRRDLSAEIAFAYLDAPVHHAPAEVVTNNHFDQDGLVAVFALVEPNVAHELRALLVDVARAGDFGVFTDRRAARAAMVIGHWDDAGWSYPEALGLLAGLVVDPSPYRDLWAEADDALARSEAALRAGEAVIAEDVGLDLAVVTLSSRVSGPLHPMAVHNATDRFRVLTLGDGVYRYADRYESWVMYQTRPTLPRVDMRPLAAQLSELDDGAVWTAGAPGELEPALCHGGVSSLGPDMVRRRIEHYLAEAAS